MNQERARKNLNIIFNGRGAKKLKELLNFDAELAQLVCDIPIGQIWMRPGLALKDKSIATISSQVAMGRWDQVANHCESFLLMGGTVTELKALFVHLSVYCGWPATLTAHRVLQETLKAKKLSKRSVKARRTTKKR